MLGIEKREINGYTKCYMLWDVLSAIKQLRTSVRAAVWMGQVVPAEGEESPERQGNSVASRKHEAQSAEAAVQCLRLS